MGKVRVEAGVGEPLSSGQTLPWAEAEPLARGLAVCVHALEVRGTGWTQMFAVVICPLA